MAYDGLAPSHPLTAASIPTSRPCSRTEDVNPQPRLVPVYRPRRDERSGWPEHILPTDITKWPTWQSLYSNPSLPVRVQRSNYQTNSPIDIVKLSQTGPDLGMCHMCHGTGPATTEGPPPPPCVKIILSSLALSV